MVHYIRFLKTPQIIDASKKSLSITAVATVTTDLGDSFFPSDVDLVVRLVDATRSGELLASQTIPWSNGSRATKIKLQCNAKFLSRLARLHLTTEQTMTSIDRYDVPVVLDVWSECFALAVDARTDSLVERLIILPGKCRIRQWEETGDSIARHIWDASLGFLILFRHMLLGTSAGFLPQLTDRLREMPTTKLKVLEVGAGCGIVGIAFAQLRKSEVLLTDLEDAQDILQSNIGIATPLAGSSVARQVLGWGPSIDVLSEPMFDLVLVSDCIYNPDSSLLLVETLLQIANHNPKVLILVGFKRRHDADDIFFERMKTVGFTVTEHCTIPLPHTITDYDAYEPEVEMFSFRTFP